MDETHVFLYFGHSNWTIWSLLRWFCHPNFPSSWSLYWEVQFLITPDFQRVEMRERDSPKNGWDTGVSVHGAFKLDHLKPVELILSPKFSSILIFILGSPIPYYPREWKWEKGIHPKMDETHGFLYSRHSNWTIWRLLSWFCHPNFPSSWSLNWEVQFLITPVSGNERKGFTQKWMRQMGFCTWGIQTGPFEAC